MENIFNDASSNKRYFSDKDNFNIYSNNLPNDVVNSNNKLKEEYLINLEGLIKGINFKLYLNR